MNYKKPAFWIVLLSVVVCVVVAVCFLTNPKQNSIKVSVETKKLSLNDVIILSQYGYDLTWSDFKQYDYIETGSGLYIRVYEINELFDLWIGGSGPDTDPMYIYLALADDIDTKIDIRDGGVTEFISEHNSASTEKGWHDTDGDGR